MHDVDMPTHNDDCDEELEPTPEEIARQYVAEHGKVEDHNDTTG